LKISPKFRNKTRMPILEIPAGVIGQEKEMKGIKIGKEVRLSQSADDMVLYSIPQRYCRFGYRPLQ